MGLVDIGRFSGARFDPNRNHAALAIALSFASRELIDDYKPFQYVGIVFGNGFAKVSFENKADIYVINTCSVTDLADKKCRNIVRKALGYNPEAFIVVIGCYAQLKPKEISKIEGVDLVLGANEKFNINEYLNDLSKKKQTCIMNAPIKETRIFVPGYSSGDRTRSFLKVQDGCNYFCSFCTILRQRK